MCLKQHGCLDMMDDDSEPLAWNMIKTDDMQVCECSREEDGCALTATPGWLYPGCTLTGTPGGLSTSKKCMRVNCGSGMCMRVACVCGLCMRVSCVCSMCMCMRVECVCVCVCVWHVHACGVWVWPGRLAVDCTYTGHICTWLGHGEKPFPSLTVASFVAEDKYLK